MSARLSPRHWLVVLVLLGTGACVRPAVADDTKEPTKDGATDETPELVTAEKGPFAVVLELDGHLDVKNSTAVAVDVDVYGGEFEAKLAPVTSPTIVKAGDLLVAFDTEKIDDQIAQARHDLEVSRVEYERAKEEAKRDAQESSRVLSRSKVERERAVEALEYFKKVERARRVLESELDLKSSEDSVADQKEELEQLRKMYKADDVVEETEAIVMRRTERSLTRSEKHLTIRREVTDRLLKVELPREHDDKEHAAATASASDDKLGVTLPLDLEKTRKELAKSELEFANSTKNLAKLEKDRALFEVKAPVAGLAVPGEFANGTWSGGDDVVKALKTKAALKPRHVLFTVVAGGGFVVRTHVPEASILDVSPGQTASVELVAWPHHALVGKVSTVGRTSDEGKFDVEFELAEQDERWMPGFAAKLKFTTRSSSDAITLAQDAIVTKGETHTVFVYADGKSTAREIETGATSGGRTEIVKGLDAGTKVLASPPK